MSDHRCLQASVSIFEEPEPQPAVHDYYIIFMLWSWKRGRPSHWWIQDIQDWLGTDLATTGHMAQDKDCYCQMVWPRLKEKRHRIHPSICVWMFISDERHKDEVSGLWDRTAPIPASTASNDLYFELNMFPVLFSSLCHDPVFTFALSVFILSDFVL